MDVQSTPGREQRVQETVADIASFQICDDPRDPTPVTLSFLTPLRSRMHTPLHAIPHLPRDPTMSGGSSSRCGSSTLGSSITTGQSPVQAELDPAGGDGSSSIGSSSAMTGESPVQAEVDDLVAARVGLMGEMMRAQQRRAQRQQQSASKNGQVRISQL